MDRTAHALVVAALAASAAACGDDAGGGQGGGPSGSTPSTGATAATTGSSTSPASGSASSGAAPVCGDGTCDDTESCATCLECCPAELGIRWVPDAGNPVLSPELPCPSPTCVAVSDPSILREDDGTLRMWFSTGGILPEGDGFRVEGPVIGHARRAPGATTFEVDPERAVVTAPVGTWDRHVETVHVLRDPSGAGFRMFYLGYEAQPGDPNHLGELHYQNPAIGQMIPMDDEGLAWARPDEPLYRPDPEGWDRFFVSGTSVVIGPDGIWRLYYGGAGTTVGVGLLTSEDGETWTPSPQNPLLDRDLAGWDHATLEPSVIHHGGRYWMWYSGYVEPLGDDTRISIGLATSEDGVTWERFGDPVLEPGAPEGWDDLRVLSSEVRAEPDGTLLMAAYGCNRRTRCDEGEISIGLWRSP